jgi:putative polyhydroxyalkanoate system protein
MQKPIQVDLPHQLGRDEARRRIANNIHKLKEHIPGGSAEVESAWQGDELDLAINALGQAVSAKIGVEETKVRVAVMLPGMLAMFAGPIEAMLQKKGNVLLEDKRD